MKKTLSDADSYEPLPEYDLSKLGPGVVGKYAHLSKQISPLQFQEEARIVVRREMKKQMEEMRAENEQLRADFQELKSRFDRFSARNSKAAPAKTSRKSNAMAQKKSA